jgi:glucokinase
VTAAGVDLGGTKCLGVLIGDGGEVLAEHRVSTPSGSAAILDALVGVIVALGSPARVGVGLPGLVTTEGVLRFAPNLPGALEVPVVAELQARLPGTAVVADNDATCAGWAETQVGAARGSQNAILVTVGTGIGGGLMTEGRVLRGSQGFAGEIGHMVIDPHGPPCVCGRQGCWEALASGRGLGRLGREAAHAGRAPRLVALAGGDPESVRGEHVTQAAREGDPGATAVMDDLAAWLAVGMANLTLALDPDMFVVGGGLVEAGEVMLRPLRAAFSDQLAGATHRAEVPIVPAQLGERAGAIGAALLATEAGDAS